YMCKTCKAGTYANNNKCETCPAGSYCIDGVKHPCQAGTFSNAGASSCTTCSAGTYSTAGTSSCTACPVGYYCNNGNKTACPTGYYCEEGSSSPSLCEYQTSMRQLTIYYKCSGGGCAVYRHNTFRFKLNYGKNSYNTLFSDAISDGKSKATVDTGETCTGEKTFNGVSWNGSLFNYGNTTANLILSCNNNGGKTVRNEVIGMTKDYCEGSVNGGTYTPNGGGCCFKNVDI
ncbi:hypothetical protein HDR60_05560, partial [bacterium]|nr:hypothetical protein [bacterium]